MSYSSTILADQPLSYYRMGDTNATLADSSGNGTNGTYTGTPGTDYTQASTALLSGDTEKSVLWQGTSGGDAQATVTVSFLTGDFSVEGWFNWAGSGTQVLFSTGTIWIGIASGVLTVSGCSGGALVHQTSVGTGSVHYWALTRISGVCTIWLDGVACTTTQTDTTSYNGTLTLTIAGLNGTSFEFSGNIQEVAFYATPHALNGTKVAAHYAAGTSGAAATSFTAPASPTTITVGASTTATITPNGTFAGTITGTPSGSASTGLSPVGKTFSGPATPQTASWTPTVAGTLTLAWTNSGTLSNAGNDTITVNAAPVTVTMDNVNILGSPYNTRIVGTAMRTSNTGAYFESVFSGTSALLNFTIPATNTVYLIWSVDSGILQTSAALTSADTQLTLATGLSAGNHTLLCAVKAMDHAIDRWTGTPPPSKIDFASLVLDGGASVSMPTTFSDNMLVYMDSNGEGWDIEGNAGLSTNDATQAFPWLLGRAFKCRVGIVAYASQGYITATGAPANVPALTTAWDHYSSGVSRLSGGSFSPAPKHIVCGHGENDGGSVAAAVSTLIAAWRAAAPSANLYFLEPPQGSHTTEISGSVTGSGDAKAFYISTGETMLIGEYAEHNPGLHLSVRGHAHYAAVVEPGMQSAIGGGGASPSHPVRFRIGSK